MSVSVEYLLRPGLEDNLLRLSSTPSKGSYAYRIGYVGDRMDRFHAALLGKVLAERSFEPRLHPTDGPEESATASARQLLDLDLHPTYPPERHRLIAARLHGTASDTRRNRQLDEAVNWLKAKEATVIYFQYQWMIKEIKERHPDLQPYRLKTVPTI